jgi:hypothetical protein
MAAEVTDERGATAGTIQLPEGSTLDEREQCLPFGAGIPATFMSDAGPSRTVMNVADCGARRLRFLWTAPPEPRGQLWFSGAIVAADGSGDVSGDGVTDFARPITAYGGLPFSFDPESGQLSRSYTATDPVYWAGEQTGTGDTTLSDIPRFLEPCEDLTIDESVELGPRG